MNIITKSNNNLLADSRAIYSIDMKYRYLLERIWDKSKPLCIWCMLNPSTATEFNNDPTIERCEVRSNMLGMGGYIILNLFAYRSKDPNQLLWIKDPVGAYNDLLIDENIQRGNRVILAWGTKGRLFNRGNIVMERFRLNKIPIFAFRLNKDGTPNHPLYISYKQDLIEI